MSESIGPVKYFFSGGFGGICTVLVGHPMDTIKVRLQTMPLAKPGESPLYKGTWDCFSKTIKQEGFRGLYKGMSAPLTGVAPIFAISFFGYGVGKKLVTSDENTPLSKAELFFAGAFSGIFTTTVMTPGERIKCLLQIQQGGNQPKKYDGMLDCAKQLYKEGGVRSLYKGTVATLCRDIPASGMYFVTYEWMKELLTPADAVKGQLGLTATIVAGGSAGIANWLVGMPADVLKSRLQTAPEGTYTGMKDVFVQLMKTEGPFALYKGVVPVMLRAFPANAACFLGLEVAIKGINWMGL